MGLTAYLAFAGALLSALMASTANPQRTVAGKLPDGQVVEAVTLTNKGGISVTVITLGASLRTVLLPDRNGQRADVTASHNSLEGYLTQPDYFGTTVGMFANRIAKGRFTLDGRS